jgi:hypothetical protein
VTYATWRYEHADGHREPLIPPHEYEPLADLAPAAEALAKAEGLSNGRLIEQVYRS